MQHWAYRMMEAIKLSDIDKAFVNVVAETSAKAGVISAGELFYIDGSGLKRCKACNERLETYISVPHMQIINMKVNCVCRCGRARQKNIADEYKRLEELAEIPQRQAECFKSHEMTRLTFDADDSPDSPIGKIIRKWVKNYNPDIKWLFLYGGFGTGKTFYAACIANEMIRRGYHVKFTNAADIAADMYVAESKKNVYDRCLNYDILILDDFAAERKSDYMYELIYNVVNDRANAGKTMIFTTNMTTAETGDPKDERLRRIMSRIWKYGYPIEFSGEDRRKIQGGWK